MRKDEAVSRQTTILDHLDDDSHLIPLRYTITSWGADYPIDSLVKRMINGDIHIPTFQRNYVWDIKQASRFIESMLLGLPVPAIFLSKDPVTKRLVIIDGLQRLKSIEYFYSGVFKAKGKKPKKFKLTKVQEEFEGLTYDQLPSAYRRELDNFLLHAIIVNQDQPENDQSSVYQIFERLNNGGVSLEPQEIRACILYGPFNDLLTELNSVPEWRTVFGPEDLRLRDVELILRFFALKFARTSYTPPMKGFLNGFMGEYRQLSDDTAERFRSTFVKAVSLVAGALGSSAFRTKGSQLNAAVFDSVMVGISDRLDRGMVEDVSGVQKAIDDLLQHVEYQSAIQKATARQDQVFKRLALAIGRFDKLI